MPAGIRVALLCLCLCFVCLSWVAEQALGEDTRKYVDIMQRVVNREETVVELELDDVLAVSVASCNDQAMCDRLVFVAVAP